MNLQRTDRLAALLTLAALFAAASAGALQIAPPTGDSGLARLAIANERLEPPARNAPWAAHAEAVAPELAAAWQEFRGAVPGTWAADLDLRNGHVGFLEGSGLSWIPGHGNQLAPGEVAAPLNASGAVDLSTLEALARRFLAEHAALLGVDPAALRLDPDRSGQAADYLWYVDFAVLREGLEISGARVLFRINNGNLIQVGTESVPPAGVTVPPTRLTREQALAVVTDYVGNFDAAWDTLLDAGTLKLLPAAPTAAAARGEIPFGAGLELVKVWEFTFRREGEIGTWRARVDASSGELLDFRNTDRYGKVTGGVRWGDNLPPDTVLPMPYADVSSGGPYANSAGLYGGSGPGITSALNGQFVRISDTCGAISMSSDGAGDILFGTSPQAATNCTTPGVGGAGNTKAARTQFYWINRSKEQARGWVTRAWLNAQLTANVNVNATCNANWNGTAVNFFRSGGGCANTGELPGVSLHEYGHGFDSNDGSGSSPDNGTGETYGDFTAALATHDSCVGGGFDLSGSNCGGYGNACLSCSGIRDIDWAQHANNTPSTVANFTQTLCPNDVPPYPGPCSVEGHCESLVSSEALWDFPNRDLSNPGSGAAWSIAERLWYLSRQTAGAAFVCTTGGTWTSNGCFATSYWRTMRAADDDDGNLNNGTPHGCDLYDAFNRHLIACTTDTGANLCFTGCSPPAAPSLTLTPGNNQISVAWTPVGGLAYDLYRNEIGCSAGFVKIANDLTTSPYLDTTVANGLAYYYQMVAQPTGNEACGSAPSSCVNATPTACATINAPTGVSAASTAANQITVSWNDSATGAVTSYDVLRATVSGGPYGVIGNVVDSGAGPWSFQDNTVSGGTTYYYVIRANAPGGCQSSLSSQASATATGECTLAPSFAGLQSITNLGGGQGCGLRLGWTAATAQCGDAVTYAVYRSTSAGFTPGPGNQIAACVAGSTYDDTTMALDTTVYYVVRAEDSGAVGGGPCNGGNLDANLAQVSGFASSTGISGSIYSHDFESATGAPFYDWVDVSFGGADATWRGRQNCAGNIFRYGGNNCSNDYGNGTFRARKPGGATGFTVPLGSTNVRLSFQHRWDFEDNVAGTTFYDGGTLALSLNGSSYTVVPSTAILTGPSYSGTVANTICTTSGTAGIPIWGSTSTGYASNTMQSTTVNLDAACNAITGGSGGCAGQTIHLAWTAISDCSGTQDGWYLDNVAITRDAIPACTAAPEPVEFLTATGRNQQVTLEWLDPSAAPFASTLVRVSTASYPADPTAGTLVTDEPGSTGDKESVPHATGAGTNGTVHYYSAFANNGGGVFSDRRTIAGLPQATAGNWKWNFATPASALAPPIQGRGLGIFVPSNDRAFYVLAIGSANGGVWKTGYYPGAMNAPAQSSPIVMLAADTGLPHDAAFVGSQDGHVYCYRADTGAGCSGWPSGGRSADGFGMVQAQPMFDPATGRILFGTRNASGANGFHALNVLTGATAWSFTNAVGQGGDGQAMGIVSGPALILGSRVLFTSRTRNGGSAHSVWALDFTASTVNFAWARDLGDIEAPPTHDWTANRVLVGTVGGAVYALDPASPGATLWTRSFADGAIRGFISYDPVAARVAFTTNSTVRSIPADGTVGDWSAGGLISPTRPLLHFGTTRWYVGSCADAGCANGRVTELDAATSWGSPKSYDLAGVGGLGPVTIDRSVSPALLHAGSRSGRVVAVELPLP